MDTHTSPSQLLHWVHHQTNSVELIPSLSSLHLYEDCSHGFEWQAQSLDPQIPPLAALFILFVCVYADWWWWWWWVTEEQWQVSVLRLGPVCCGVVWQHYCLTTVPLTPSLLPASPRETWRVMGTGTAGASLAGAFTGGLCGLLVSCYGPVTLTKQGPVKLSRGWISGDMYSNAPRGDGGRRRGEENQDEETTGANVDAKWEWQVESWSEGEDGERGKEREREKR